MKRRGGPALHVVSADNLKLIIDELLAIGDDRVAILVNQRELGIDETGLLGDDRCYRPEDSTAIGAALERLAKSSRTQRPDFEELLESAGRGRFIYMKPPAEDD